MGPAQRRPAHPDLEKNMGVSCSGKPPKMVVVLLGVSLQPQYELQKNGMSRAAGDLNPTAPGSPQTFRVRELEWLQWVCLFEGTLLGVGPSETTS